MRAKTKKILPAYPLIIILFEFIFTITGCSSGGGDESKGAQGESQSIAPASTQEDMLAETRIAGLIYAGKRIPDDFYHEPARDTNNFYTIHHVKNSNVSAQGSTTSIYELCSNDFAEALGWSEQDMHQQPRYMDLVSTQQNEMFFEFTRVSANTPTFINLTRVFKCSFIDRSIISNAHPDRVAALNASPLQASHIKNAAEYLWTISPHNNYGYAVVMTGTQETSAYIIHQITEAKLQTATTTDQCDTIEVNKIEYTVDKASRQIQTQASLIKRFTAKYSNGTYTVCAG